VKFWIFTNNVLGAALNVPYTEQNSIAGKFAIPKQFSGRPVIVQGRNVNESLLFVWYKI